MTTPCDDLDIFFDGELSADRAQAFRVHLATCTRCQHALRGRMLESVVMAHGAEGCACPAIGDATDPPDQLAARRRSRRWTVMVAAVAASVALVSGPERREQTATRATDAGHPPNAPRPTIIALADVSLAAKRPVEVRFSTTELDRHRPPDIVRAVDPVAREQITRATLARLESQGHWNALVAALALNGEVRSATESAKRLPNTAQSLSDRAALELLRFQDAGRRVPPAEQQQAAEQAISLAAAALRLDPSCAQAKWNQAIALRRLGLPLAAAQAFDEIAAKDEPGWSNEAKDAAARIRDGYRIEADEWKRRQDDAQQMIGGGAVLTAESAQQYPSLARRTLYLAAATASTKDRFDALLPIAETLDRVYAGTTLGALVKQVRASNLVARAPVARALREFIVNHGRVDALEPIRKRGLELGMTDLVLASFLVQNPADTNEHDLALLGKLAAGNQDVWWRVFELQRRSWSLEYDKRDSASAEAATRAAAPLCSAVASSWCGQIARTAGDANAVMGRLDVALERLEAARKMARDPKTRDNEASVLNVIAQVMSMRVQEAIDSVAVSDAYYNEVELRGTPCSVRLQRLDILASAAIERHRYQQAAELLARAEAIEERECRDESLRNNEVAARLRLVETGHGDATKLQQQLARLESEGHKTVASHLHYLRAAATAYTDRAKGESALQSVIAAADADPSEPNALLARASAYASLIEIAAMAGDADNVLALLARRLDVAVPGGCVVGIAQWNRAVIAVRGVDRGAAVQTRSVPEGAVMLPPGELVPAPLQARLAGCRRVTVLASGPYFGSANVLPPTIAWAYKSSSRTAARSPSGGTELVVTDVRPPDDIPLPELRSFHGSPSALVLAGSRATPGATLQQMKTAGLIVIVAHGVTDAREPNAASLILSPDRDGDYLLTASKVTTAHLEGDPVVVLAGCDAGRVLVSAEPWSLATSFLAAGARAVIAPTEKIPDDDASTAFESLVARIRSGVDPVDALQAEREKHGPDAAWLSSIIVFE